ncbi:hypothetical protein LTR40_014476, partial [Exophiala xenobiotica]
STGMVRMQLRRRSQRPLAHFPKSMELYGKSRLLDLFEALSTLWLYSREGRRSQMSLGERKRVDAWVSASWLVQASRCGLGGGRRCHMERMVQWCLRCHFDPTSR